MPKRALGPWATLAALLGGCAAPTPSIELSGDAAEVMKLVGCPLLPARVDGQEVDVLIDTGSPCSVIDEASARRLGLGVRSYWLPHALAFIGGTQFTRHHATIERLELSRLGIGPLELPLVDLAAGAGYGGGALVLGCEVLRQCRILFEARSRGLRFLSARSPEELAHALRRLQPGRTFVPLDVRWVDAHPYVTVSLASGPPRRILVDTGALQTFVSEEMTRAWGLEREPEGSAQCFVDGLTIGPWRVRLVATLDPFMSSGALGFDVLSEFTFAWDGPGGKLWIAGPRSGEPATLAAGWFIQDYLRQRGLEDEGRLR